MQRTLTLFLTVAIGCSSGTSDISGDAGVDAGPNDIDGAPGGGALVPNPLISRGVPVFASSGTTGAAEAVDGEYKTGSWGAGKPSVGAPAWLAIHVGAGATRLILSWNAGGSYNYLETDYGSPADYRIEVSASSTNGADGTWTPVVTVTANPVRTREHAFDFTGKSWVRFVVTAAPAVSPNGVQIDEIDLHDASLGSQDTWFFMGDSITAFWADRGNGGSTHQPSFAEGIHAAHATFFPLMIDGGIGGEKSVEGVGHIDQWLLLNPDCKYFGIQYGTNDAAGNGSDTTEFRANMQTLIDRVKAAGRIPILARIPYATDGQHDHLTDFNAVVDDLTATNHLTAGPDFYAWFLAHPGELADGIHPNDAGMRSMNVLWTAAMTGLY